MQTKVLPILLKIKIIIIIIINNNKTNKFNELNNE